MSIIIFLISSCKSWGNLNSYYFDLLLSVTGYKNMPIKEVACSKSTCMMLCRVVISHITLLPIKTHTLTLIHTHTPTHTSLLADFAQRHCLWLPAVRDESLSPGDAARLGNKVPAKRRQKEFVTVASQIYWWPSGWFSFHLGGRGGQHAESEWTKTQRAEKSPSWAVRQQRTSLTSSGISAGSSSPASWGDLLRLHVVTESLFIISIRSLSDLRGNQTLRQSDALSWLFVDSYCPIYIYWLVSFVYL